MLVVISLDQDGGIEVREAGEKGKLIVSINSAVFVLLDMFNEGKKVFSWEGDADRSAEMLLWRLEDLDLMPKVMSEYHNEMRDLCMPGGPTGSPFQIELVTAA